MRRFAAVILLATGSAVAACANISGIGSFSKGDCSGGVCGDDASVEGGTMPPGLDATADAGDGGSVTRVEASDEVGPEAGVEVGSPGTELEFAL